MPEAKLAREAEISYVLLALVTDYDCWKRPPGSVGAAPQGEALLREIQENLGAATEQAVRVIRRAVQVMAGRREELLACPAQEALKLAIWSEKGAIEPEEIDRLRPLWGRHFE